MWWSIIPFVLVTAVIVWTPGWAVSTAAGIRPLIALGLAPAVSVGVVASAAVLAGFAGVEWGPMPVLLWTAGLVGLAWGARVVLRRKLNVGRLSHLMDAAVPHSRHSGKWWASPTCWMAVAMVLAGILMIRDLVTAIGSPSNFSQTYDNIFHLNAVRWILDNGVGSALDMRMTSGDAAPSFYPTAWHDIVSLALTVTGGQDVVAATNAMILVSGAIIWPAGCLLLTHVAFPFTRISTLVAGILTSSFAAFPYLLLEFGVLYPNLLGLCLVPSMIAVALSCSGLGKGQRLPVFGAGLTLLVGLAGVGLAHPNTALVLCAIVIPLLIWDRGLRALTRDWKTGGFTRRSALPLLALMGSAVVAAGLLYFLRPPRDAAFWGPMMSVERAVLQAVLVAPLGLAFFVVPALLAAVGSYAVVRTGHHRWLLAVHLVFCGLWLIAASYPIGRLRWWTIGPWYSDPPRLASLLPLTGLPLAVLGLQFIEGKLERLLPGGSVRAWVVGTIVVAVVVASTAFSEAKSRTIAAVASTYEISATSALVNSDEYAVIMQVPSLVPEDEAIAVNPYNGSSMVYALTGRHTTATHVLYSPTPDQEVIIDDLNNAANDPKVCDALADLNVQWVLDFGDQDLINDMDASYPGFADLSERSGFVLRAHSGNAALYEITACKLG